MTADPYARSGRRRAFGAELVYGPVAAELVAMSPHPLAGRTVLDAGAGTGAASAALRARNARVLAMDRSAGLLAWNAAAGPPFCVCAGKAGCPAAAAPVTPQSDHPPESAVLVGRPGTRICGILWSLPVGSA